MSNPVVACDGFSYERAAIEKWLTAKDTSPMSNAPLATKVGGSKCTANLLIGIHNHSNYLQPFSTACRLFSPTMF